MSKIEIKIPFDDEKLAALNYALHEDGTTATQAIEKAVTELYENAVPQILREYIDSRFPAPAKQKRVSRSVAKPTTENAEQTYDD